VMCVPLTHHTHDDMSATIIERRASAAAARADAATPAPHTPTTERKSNITVMKNAPDHPSDFIGFDYSKEPSVKVENLAPTPKKRKVTNGDSVLARLVTDRRKIQTVARESAIVSVKLKECVIVITNRADAVIDTPGFANEFEKSTGIILIPKKSAEIVQYNDDEPEPDAHSQYDIRWQRYKCRRNGLPSFIWKPAIQGQTAIARGYASIKEYVLQVITPRFAALQYNVVIRGSDVQLLANLKSSIAFDGRFMIKGDTNLVHPGVVNFRDYGLTWNEPYWLSKDDSYDPEPLIEFLDACVHVTIE
jgi:hypothetical protein